MCVGHRLLNGGMPQNLLQGNDVSPVHHEVYSAAKHLIPICISFDTDKK